LFLSRSAIAVKMERKFEKENQKTSGEKALSVGVRPESLHRRSLWAVTDRITAVGRASHRRGIGSWPQNIPPPRVHSLPEGRGTAASVHTGQTTAGG
jgi:hypothetical protein